MRFDQLIESDPFGEKPIVVLARNLSQTQINQFLLKMQQYEQNAYNAANGLFSFYVYDCTHGAITKLREIQNFAFSFCMIWNK